VCLWIHYCDIPQPACRVGDMMTVFQELGCVFFGDLSKVSPDTG
jgi:hypothetical protein